MRSLAGAPVCVADAAPVGDDRRLVARSQSCHWPGCGGLRLRLTRPTRSASPGPDASEWPQRTNVWHQGTTTQRHRNLRNVRGAQTPGEFQMKRFLLAALAVVREGIEDGPLGLDERRKGDPCGRPKQMALPQEPGHMSIRWTSASSSAWSRPSSGSISAS